MLQSNNNGSTPRFTAIQGDAIPNFEQLLQSRNLNGKKGLVIGMGLGGIAQGCVAVLSAYGAQLAIASINEKVLSASEKLIDDMDWSVKLRLTCDVSQKDSIACLFSSLKTAGWTELDFVVFSVAGARKEEIVKPLIEATREGLNEAMSISVYPVIEIARECQEMMPHGGTIITFGYLGESRYAKGYDYMALVKAALNAADINLAGELGVQGIRFHNVSPGPIMTRAASGLPGFKDLKSDSERMSMSPGKNVTIYDVGQMTAFLVSPAAVSMTADTIYMDYGTHAMGIPDHQEDSAPAQTAAASNQSSSGMKAA